MATYTMPLKEIIEQPTQNRDDLTLKQKIEVGRVNLFKGMEYELFNDLYRREFETKFIRYFYNKEIGFETEGLFKFELETWLQINMPYYNQLFESELLKYDPLTNISMRVDQNLKQDTTQDTTQDTKQDSKDKSTTESSFEHHKDRDVLTDSESHSTQNVKGNSETDSTQDTTNKSKTNSTSDATTDTDSNTKQDAFNRVIKSDNPDSRLYLSSNEGSGVIEYANNIDETLDKSTGNTTTNSQTKDTSQSTTDTTDNTTGHTETNDTQDTKSDTNENSKTDDTETTDGWDRSETNATGEIVGNIIGNNVGNKVEDMFNERYGKEGTVTYQQMIKELRETFIRIERQIFKEMSELFMLLY